MPVGFSLSRFWRTERPFIVNSRLHVALFISPSAELLGRYTSVFSFIIPQPRRRGLIQRSVLSVLQSCWALTAPLAEENGGAAPSQCLHRMHRGAQHPFYSCRGLPKSPVPGVRPMTALVRSSTPQGPHTYPITSTSPSGPYLSGRPLRGGPAAILGSSACAARRGSGSDGAGAEQCRQGYGWPGVRGGS